MNLDLPDLICDICLGNESEQKDPLLTCSSCGLSAHFSCLLEKHSKPENLVRNGWICQKCKSDLKKSVGILAEYQEPRCSICPDRNGIITFIKSDRLWVHFTCVNWINDYYFDDSAYSPSNSLNVSLTRPKNQKRKEYCWICGHKYGETIPCDARGCFENYHPRCARSIGLIRRYDLMETMGSFVFCLKHLKQSHPEDYFKRNYSTRMRGFPKLAICDDRVSQANPEFVNKALSSHKKLKKVNVIEPNDNWIQSSSEFPLKPREKMKTSEALEDKLLCNETADESYDPKEQRGKRKKLKRVIIEESTTPPPELVYFGNSQGNKDNEIFMENEMDEEVKSDSELPFQEEIIQNERESGFSLQTLFEKGKKEDKKTLLCKRRLEKIEFCGGEEGLEAEKQTGFGNAFIIERDHLKRAKEDFQVFLKQIKSKRFRSFEELQETRKTLEELSCFFKNGGFDENKPWQKESVVQNMENLEETFEEKIDLSSKKRNGALGKTSTSSSSSSSSSVFIVNERNKVDEGTQAESIDHERTIKGKMERKNGAKGARGAKLVKKTKMNARPLQKAKVILIEENKKEVQTKPMERSDKKNKVSLKQALLACPIPVLPKPKEPENRKISLLELIERDNAQHEREKDSTTSTKRHISQRKSSQKQQERFKRTPKRQEYFDRTSKTAKRTPFQRTKEAPAFFSRSTDSHYTPRRTPVSEDQFTPRKTPEMLETLQRSQDAPSSESIFQDKSDSEKKTPFSPESIWVPDVDINSFIERIKENPTIYQGHLATQAFQLVREYEHLQISNEE